MQMQNQKLSEEKVKAWKKELQTYLQIWSDGSWQDEQKTFSRLLKTPVISELVSVFPEGANIEKYIERAVAHAIKVLEKDITGKSPLLDQESVIHARLLIEQYGSKLPLRAFFDCIDRIRVRETPFDDIQNNLFFSNAAMMNWFRKYHIYFLQQKKIINSYQKQEG